MEAQCCLSAASLVRGKQSSVTVPQDIAQLSIAEGGARVELSPDFLLVQLKNRTLHFGAAMRAWAAKNAIGVKPVWDRGHGLDSTRLAVKLNRRRSAPT